MTLVSRLLGFVRDMVIARAFGADDATDAFFVAFRIPNFLRRLFAEGSFAQAFVPAITASQNSADPLAHRRFLDRATGTLACLFLLGSLLGVAASPLLILAFAPGFADEPERFALASDLLRITLPYLFFVTMTAFSGAILNASGHFAIPAVTPALLNVVMIACAVRAAPHFSVPVTALAVGVAIAGVLQLAIQIPALAAAGLLPRPRLGFDDPEVRRLLRRMGPAIFGVSVTQVNLLVDTLIASFLMAGSVSWLYYSDRLVEFPLGLFGVAIATAILPQLAKAHATNDPERFSAMLDWALRWILLIGIPAMLGLILLAEPLMSGLFQYDRFGSHDVTMAARSLATYAVGLPGFIAVKVLASGFNARHDLRTPLRCGLYAMIANALLGLMLGFGLADDGYGHAGLALATALAAWINSGLLGWRLLAERIYRPAPGWLVFLLRMIAANLAMGALLWTSTQSLQWQELAGPSRALHLFGWISAGAAAYAATLLLSGLRPAHLMVREAR